MGDVIGFDQHRKAPKPVLAIARKVERPVTIACHCGQTAYELRADFTISCPRCGCTLPAKWSWTESTPT